MAKIFLFAAFFAMCCIGIESQKDSTEKDRNGTLLNWTTFKYNATLTLVSAQNCEYVYWKNQEQKDIFQEISRRSSDHEECQNMCLKYSRCTHYDYDGVKCRLLTGVGSRPFYRRRSYCGRVAERSIRPASIRLLSNTTRTKIKSGWKDIFLRVASINQTMIKSIGKTSILVFSLCLIIQSTVLKTNKRISISR